MRHAVSINENEHGLAPVLYGNSLVANINVGAKSHIEAWFVGNHLDIGGGATYDGLSLYPLQWILRDSKSCGLYLMDKPDTSTADISPFTLGLFLPVSSQTNVVGPNPSATKKESQELSSSPWVFEFSNKITVEMYDIRRITAQGNLQKPREAKLKKVNKKQLWPEKLDQYMIYHHVCFNKTSALVSMIGFGSFIPKPRVLFDGRTGELLNYYQGGMLRSIKSIFEFRS